jgi:hypothetical protein
VPKVDDVVGPEGDAAVARARCEQAELLKAAQRVHRRLVGDVVAG